MELVKTIDGIEYILVPKSVKDEVNKSLHALFEIMDYINSKVMPSSLHTIKLLEHYDKGTMAKDVRIQKKFVDMVKNLGMVKT